MFHGASFYRHKRRLVNSAMTATNKADPMIDQTIGKLVVPNQSPPLVLMNGGNFAGQMVRALRKASRCLLSSMRRKISFGRQQFPSRDRLRSLRPTAYF